MPSPSLRLSPCENPVWRKIWDGQKISGLRAELYPYQRHTVASMLQNEMDPTVIADPLYFPLHTVDKRSIFLCIDTIDIRLEQPTVPTVRGGVLCEGPGEGFLGVLSTPY